MFKKHGRLWRAMNYSSDYRRVWLLTHPLWCSVKGDTNFLGLQRWRWRGNDCKASHEVCLVTRQVMMARPSWQQWRCGNGRKGHCTAVHGVSGNRCPVAGTTARSQCLWWPRGLDMHQVVQTPILKHITCPQDLIRLEKKQIKSALWCSLAVRRNMLMFAAFFEHSIQYTPVIQFLPCQPCLVFRSLFQVALLHAFQTPVTLRLLALTRCCRIVLSNLGWMYDTSLF